METITQPIWTAIPPEESGLYLIAWDSGVIKAINVETDSGKPIYRKYGATFHLYQVNDTQYFGPIEKPIFKIEESVDEKGENGAKGGQM